MKKIAKPVRQNKSLTVSLHLRQTVAQTKTGSGWYQTTVCIPSCKNCDDVFIVLVYVVPLNVVAWISSCLQIPFHLNVCIHHVFTVCFQIHLSTTASQH